MRSLVALAALAVADAGKKAKGEYSWDQAKCLFKKRKIVFLGDSNTRFFSFQFATFLEKGEYRSDDYDKWGEPGDDYDKEYEDETWTDWSRKSKKSATHAQHLVKTYDDLDSRHTFFFLQKTWFGDETTKEENMDDIAAKVKKDEVDIVVMNSGWWDLKGWGEKDYDDCGEDWEDDCGDAYERDVKKAADEIFSGAKAAVWRDCSCCGDETSHEKSVKRLNAIAKDVMDDRGYPVAEIFDLYGKKDLDDATVDGTHATPEYYHAWTMKIMTGVEAQLKTGCLGDSYEDDEPASCPGLEAVASDGCPADADLVTCDDASLQPGDLCEGDGECGTDKKLNNCPDGTGGTEADVYVLGDAPAPTTAPTPKVPVPEPVPEVPVPAPEPVPELPVPAPEPAPTPDNPIIIYDDPDESDGAAARAVAAALAAAGLALLA